MHYKTVLKGGAILLAASMLTLGACKHNSTTTPALTTSDDNGGYASDGAKLETTNNDVISIADAAASTSSGANLRTTQTTLGSCATVTNDTAVIPHVLTINFGTSDCLCLDGKERRGSIIVTYSGHYKDSASSHTITYSNYFVNDIQVTGNKTVINEGTNMSGQVWYNVTVNDSLIYGTDSIASWTGSRTRTWLAGYSTPTRTDDVYAIGGVTTLTRPNGHVFTFTISTSDPLYVALDCPWIESGQVTVTGITLAEPRIINYGTEGSCDATATLTIGGTVYTITLK